MRALPTAFAVALNRTSAEPSAATSIVLEVGCANSTTEGSSDLIVTVALPGCLSCECTTAPKYALSPTARKRGQVGVSSTGLLMRISFCAQPKRDALSPATAMMRYVVRDSGNVMSVLAWPFASVTTDPTQNASTRKSLR